MIALGLAWACAGLLGCFRPETIEGRPCPCAEGFTCCANRCTAVRSAVACQSDAGPDASPPDARDGEVAASTPDARDSSVDRPAPVDGGDAAPDEPAPDAAPELREHLDAPGEVAAPGDGPVADGRPDAGEDGASCPDAGATVRVLGSAFLDIAPQVTDRFYTGYFRLGPCEHLVNDQATVIYVQDQGSIPPLSAGLTILHTFDPAGPGMTSPGVQPPGKYYIDSPVLSYDALTNTYKYAFHGVNFVTCPDAGSCKYIDSTQYRVVIDVR